MGIYIKGIKMPKAGDCFIVFSDGDVWSGGKRIGKVGTAIELPPHGRLGDLDALFDKAYTAYGTDMDEPEANRMMEMVSSAPTIIPTEGGEDG